MEQKAFPYQKIIFICTNSREQGACCALRGSELIRGTLKRYVKENGLAGKVRISRSGCMNLCSLGPNVMIFPDGVWYKDVQPGDIATLIENHLAHIKEP